MWTKAEPGDRPQRRKVISQRGFRRMEVVTGGLVGDDTIMIADDDTRNGKERRLIWLDYEQAVGVIAELQRFIDSEDDFRKNYREV